MVVITIELVSGPSMQRRHLGTMTITNDATGSLDVGHYNVMLSKWGRPQEPWRRGRVTDFPRKRLGPWDLLLAALKNTVGDRAAPEPVFEDPLWRMLRAELENSPLPPEELQALVDGWVVGIRERLGPKPAQEVPPPTP